MRSSPMLLFATSSLFIGQTLAFPLLWSSSNSLPKRIPQAPSYSVVAVDGGSSSASGPLPSSTPPATKTVTDAITQVQTATVMSTILSTITATATDSQAITIPTTIVSAQTITVSTQPSVTSMPYDDGQWHTTYYFRSTFVQQANAAVASTQSSAQPSITSIADPGSWAYWSGKNNGGL